MSDKPIKAFISSPYRSHVCFETHGPSAPIRDAMLATIRLSRKFQPCIAVADVPRLDRSCCWSPLIEGDILRAQGVFNGEEDALAWCLYHLEHSGFTHVVVCSDDTIPRRKGYGKNGCDVEVARAISLGLTVVSETQLF